MYVCLWVAGTNVCLRAFAYLCTDEHNMNRYIHAHVCVREVWHERACVHTHIHTHDAHKHTNTHTYIHTYTHTHTHTYTHTHTQRAVERLARWFNARRILNLILKISEKTPWTLHITALLVQRYSELFNCNSTRVIDLRLSLTYGIHSLNTKSRWGRLGSMCLCR